ncbi:TlyA family RNA methyltransferase [Rhodoplanes sp. TEM]|uniref:TlyA family RNA methyltransferase n=1 Tax=Rhodoplanes tepidamans TaxID=200616 RepID=A0ABT5J7G0_RHOTP|nr:MULTISPECIES: TlyA family RNA methyltransferase [Rhodoplanes]MDC7785448.1 TlyA family RNA methyltransferase [Rhodoplanes tepidamans]MDC7985771.1 TlyA family RNA methyltransferase [Rhodoplanes sp. TEM]MDQ0353098.1 23S rRNA (cytidine1920-2'-O)/16S rRNA (cytidine1409-2'-O)-methyltransferase [Rhodoplanes tepidamans]
MSRLRAEARLRADRLLVDRGLFESRAKAQAAIAAGLVKADGVPVGKPSDTIAPDAVIEALPAHPYVSRGALKLAAALDAGPVNPADRVCLDVGASTGGFTELLLTRGARKVYAVDVGRDQLHARLRAHPRVVSLEATDIRSLTAAVFDAAPSLVVVDVSFIPLALVLPAALALAAPDCDLVALIKPQFEAGREHVKKGLVRDPAVHAAVCDGTAALVRSLRCEVRTVLPSPITGGDGNREFLLVARRGT